MHTRPVLFHSQCIAGLRVGVMAPFFLLFCRGPHSGQTQNSNVTSGFRRFELCKKFEKKTCETFVGKCYKSSTARENYKLGDSEDVR